VKIFARDNLLSKNPSACIWMQAGVVFLKDCHQDFNCSECQFDRALRRASRENEELREQGITPSGRKGKIVFWKEKLKKKSPAKRPCIHSMRRHIDFKACHREYNCINCDFDQYFNDQYKVYTVVKPIDFKDVHGVHLPGGYYLHKGHTWAKIESDNEVRIGLDEFALKLLGRLDKIEAPLVGKMVAQGQGNIIGYRGENTVAFASPVNGVVTAINAGLRKKGYIAGKDPYTDGWVMRVHCKTLRNDLKHLFFMDEAESFVNNEIEKLYAILEQETGLMAADGGNLGDDIFGNAPSLSWNRLVSLFFTS
jgi:glycine cleavage system H lipoate-binding protein